MICVGIESTAHTFGVGIVDETGNILANEKESYTTEKGGIIPIEAAQHHEKICDEVLVNAFKKAKTDISDVDVIAFSAGPGLGPCLRVGAGLAKKLHEYHKIPVLGVNHPVAHLEIGKVMGSAENPILLYVSGANTQVIALENGKYRIFGETLDNGIGNFLDGIARHLGLGFPGGPKLAALAEQGEKYIELPYVVKGMDVSFGGIQTNVKQKIDSEKFRIEDLAYSIQETVFAMMVEVAERALWHTGKKELVLGGGVACNTRLQEMCQLMCKDNGFRYFCPENQLLVDNGAMIAWLGILMNKEVKHASMKNKKLILNNFDIRPYERTDDSEVYW
jgi:N6-L-threonylcarbamoyladenine synthase